MKARWLPQPMMSGVLWGVWLLLVGEISVGHLVLGALLAWGIPLLTRPFRVLEAPVKRPAVVWRLLCCVLVDIVRANWAVLQRVLGPIAALQPAFVEVPLQLRNDVALTLLTSIITLTPGTVSVALSADKRVLLVHGLDVPDDAALIDEIQQRYEAPLREIFECSTS